MAFEDTEQVEFEEVDSHATPLWVVMIWGGVTIMLGVALAVAMWSFNVKEIGWDYLNKSGEVIEGTTNLLGHFGLYYAGGVYWVFGAMSWFIPPMLVWWGVYRLRHYGELARPIFIGGLCVLCFGTVILTMCQTPGVEWVAEHQLLGAGGLVGDILGVHLLEPLMGDDILIGVSTLGYIISLVYALDYRWKPFLKGCVIEYKFWRERRKTQKLEREAEKLARDTEELRESMNETWTWGRPVGIANKSAMPLQEDLDSLEEDVQMTPTVKRSLFDEQDEFSTWGTGNAVENEPPKKQEQSSMELPIEPRITVAKPSQLKSMPKVQPFTKTTAPPSDEYANYKLPGFELLNFKEQKGISEEDRQEMFDTQQRIIDTIAQFGYTLTAGDITRGPTITRYEFYPPPGVRVMNFLKFQNDIALATSATAISMHTPIPGKNTMGIEIENKHRMPVQLRELLQSEAFCSPKKKIPVALGKNVYGEPVIGDLAGMPHMLVAGTTGSGKSVCINCMLISMIMKFRPDELRLIMVDPKMVEMMPYASLPHLAMPVLTDAEKVPNALRWCVNEMEHRYHCFSKTGVRNLEDFNNRPKDTAIVSTDAPSEDYVDLDGIEAAARELESSSEGDWGDEDDELDFDDAEIPDRFPYIVVVIDELADLMQQTGAQDVEHCIARLAQKARAAGIHLILATQTPRKDVITGKIKANIPTRLSCKVSSGVDSRVILEQQGAEKLVGKGDLLFIPPGSSLPERAQGAWISDEEIQTVVQHCAMQAKQDFLKSITETINNINTTGSPDGLPSLDDQLEELYTKSLEVVVTEGKASTSLIQRRLKIGYNKAANLMEMLEARKVIAPSDGTSKPRKILIDG